MGYFFENFNQNNFSVDFGQDVSFTDYYNYQNNNISHDMSYLFWGCSNYNSSLRIPDSVVDASSMFYNCGNLNQPIYIDPHHQNLRSMYGMFSYCNNFNQDINIPENVNSFRSMFYYCGNYCSNVYVYAKTSSGEPNNYSSAFRDSYGFNGNVHFVNCTPYNMSYTFYQCYDLNQNIQIPSTAYNMYSCFECCYNLNQPIKVPDNSMAYGCFKYCYNLNQSVPIPRNANIAQMFMYCNNLNEALYIPVCKGSNEYDQRWNSYGLLENCTNFNASVIFEHGWLGIYNIFQNCSSFNYPITITDSVTDMHATFSNCRNLNTSITFSNNLINMYYVFESCHNYNIAPTLPSGLKNMYGAFSGCTNFNVAVQIPDGVEVMSSTFSSCENFNVSLTLPSSLQEMTSCFRYCYNFDQPIILPSGLNWFDSTFADCYKFNQPITIPSGVTRMASTFDGCSNFNQPVTLPSSLIEANWCFNGCVNMTHPITIPSHCTNFANICVFSGITNISIQSTEFNYRTGTGGYGIQGISVVSVRGGNLPNHQSGSYEYHQLINLSGKSVGDTVMRININRDALLYYEAWNSTSQNYTRYNHSVQEIYFDQEGYLYRLFGISDGYVGSSYRTYYQPDNYADYTANFHDNMPSIWIDSGSYADGYIKFNYCDWRNTTGGVTPNYAIYFSLI